jgi:hypothetical protein
MNKLIKGLYCLAFMVTLVLPSLANAEEKSAPVNIGVSAWGRTIFSPVVSNDGGEKHPTTGASWGGNGGRIGWTIKGSSANVGFQVDMNCDGGEIGFQDQQKVWAKPVDFLTVEIGPSIFYETLRGDAAFGAWNWMRYSDLDDEDAIFVRGKAGGGDQNGIRQNSSGIQGGWDRENGIYAGSIIHVDHKGFHAFASLDQSYGSLIQEETSEGAGDEVREQYTTADMFKRGQYGAGYEIPGVGLIRAQYIGKAYLKNSTDDKLTNYGIINAALKLDKIVDNFYIDLGYFKPTEEQKKTEDGEGYEAYNGYMKYAAGSVTVHGTVQTKLDKLDSDGEEGTAIHAGIGVDVSLPYSLAITTDLRWFNNNWNAQADGDDTIACMFGISRGFSNGKIGIGIEYTSNSFQTDATKENSDDAMWSVPVVVEYGF